MGLKPDFQIIADHNNITPIIAKRLIELRIEDEAGFQSDSATLMLDDRDGAIEVPKTGVELVIDLGYANQLQRMGIFTVDEVEISHPPAKLTIKARAAKMKQSLKVPKDRSFRNIKLGTLFEQVSQTHGYDLALNDKLAEIELVQVDQRSESDLNLMTRLAKDHNAIFKLTTNKIVLIPASQNKSVSGIEMPEIYIAANQVQNYRLTMADRNKYIRVVAKYRDLKTAAEVQVSHGSGEPAFVLRRIYPDQASAQSAAVAKLASLQRGTGSLSLSVLGDPAISAERVIVLENLRNKIDNRWRCQQVSHTLGTNGFQTNITADIPSDPS